jgi:hypothetical protein
MHRYRLLFRRVWQQLLITCAQSAYRGSEQNPPNRFFPDWAIVSKPRLAVPSRGCGWGASLSDSRGSHLENWLAKRRQSQISWRCARLRHPVFMVDMRILQAPYQFPFRLSAENCAPQLQHQNTVQIRGAQLLSSFCGPPPKVPKSA